MTRHTYIVVIGIEGDKMKRLTLDQVSVLRASTCDGLYAWPTGGMILRWRAAVRRGLARETYEVCEAGCHRGAVPVFEALDASLRVER